MSDEGMHRAFQSEQGFLTAVLENVEDGIVACDAQGILVLFNRAAREFHAQSEKPIHADQWAEYYDLYLPNGKTRMTKEEIPLFRALQGEHVRNAEMVIAPGGGTKRTLLASGRALYGPGGEKLGAVVVMHDITERKQAQDALKHESELMRALMDNIPDAIYFKDTESRFTRVNRHAPYRGNISSEEVIGKTDFDFFVEEHARAAYEDEQQIISTGVPIIDKIEKETYTDGSTTWLSTTKVPIFDEAGRVTGIVGISRDITERKRAEEERIQLIREQAARAEAEASNRRKDEFLAVVSHELRTPLTPILGWASILRKGGFDEATLAHGLETIERSARSQQQLVEDLLDVSRIITGNLRLNLTSLEIGPVAEAAIDAMRQAAEAKGVRILYERELVTERVNGDPERLQQILWNLLANAIKFTPSGGSVAVSLMRARSCLEIRVSDTGQGIRPEFLPHVFDRFRQADSSTTRSYGGLGLGLAIVRHLVELHGGTVRAESAGVGEGATFTVTLPLASDNEQAVDSQPPSTLADTGEASESSRSLHGLRVLVVDDELNTLRMLAALLEGYGAEVNAVASADEALKALESWRPHVLVSDIGMPGDDGYALIRKVRAFPAERGGQVPAAALTAYTRPEDRTRALMAGYQIHVSKPFEPTELVAVVARLAGRATVA
ncbi:MAG TPA: PAS domain-containing protein [Pyrinomonadaceae bacterium]|jgi:PAS domain S-box-containing protein